MVQVKTQPKSLFEIQIFKDGDYGEPRIKNQYLKSNKTKSEIRLNLEKRLGHDAFNVNKVSKAEFAKGKSENNISRRYPKADLIMESDAKDVKKEYKKWSNAYKKIQAKYKTRRAIENAKIKSVNQITNVAKKINPTNKVNTVKDKAIKVIKTGVKLGGVVGLIGSLFTVTTMGDGTLKKK